MPFEAREYLASEQSNTVHTLNNRKQLPLITQILSSKDQITIIRDFCT
ncbi:hypothetical Protein YC6258_04272 [Gynuella sunshinyii YC6258]|uniref:Uncharacterized protein n=1 Tax=Gynuella sunshinyii YC6258 TaxID=1445510 RepID=A0A0C5VQ02_9GAMM|nr:hypothetical Protein YC6258_04272 [Gynuella sunshinyii YC6258]